MPEVDHPATTTLSTTLRTPSHLPEATSSRNDVARRGAPDQVNLKCSVLLIVQQVTDSRGEHASLKNDHRKGGYAIGV